MKNSKYIKRKFYNFLQLINKLLGPKKPIFIASKCSENSLTLFYSPPSDGDKGNDSSKLPYMYFVEYWRSSNQNASNNFTATEDDSGKALEAFFVWTNSTTLRLRNLDPDTAYRLRLSTVLFGVKSRSPLELLLRTKCNFELKVPLTI